MAARSKTRARRKPATRRKPRTTARKKTKAKASRSRGTKRAAGPKRTTTQKKSAAKKRVTTTRKTAAARGTRAKALASKPRPTKPSVQKPPTPLATRPAVSAKPAPTTGAAQVSAPSASIAATVPELVGHITHYFAHVNAGVIALERGELRLGDTVHIRGHTTDFYQRLEHMEVDHRPIEHARAGQSVGIQVPQRVREHDQVFKVSK